MNLKSVVKTHHTYKTWPGVIALSLTLLLPATRINAAPHQELQGVKGEIARQKKSLQSQSHKLDTLQASLKSQELTIVALEKKITATKQKLATANANIQQLEHKIARLEQQKMQQADHLKQLITTYYLTRKHHAATSMLKDNSEEDRISQYYQSLAKQRTTAIQALKATQAALSDNEQQLKNEQETISQLLTKQTQRYHTLKHSQSSRQSTVKKIRSSISSDKQYLAELHRNESRLKAEIAKATKRNTVQMNGLSAQKGQLSWPVTGNVLHHFGTRQTGQVVWKGIVIAANYGQAVKAVSSGTVVFSAYLRGYGLVILLNHGKGDMTLYGYNQSLLKKEGDKVLAGETIALAGDTGGQSQPSLYFEVRRNSRAQNPLVWLKH